MRADAIGRRLTGAVLLVAALTLLAAFALIRLRRLRKKPAEVGAPGAPRAPRVVAAGQGPMTASSCSRKSSASDVKQQAQLRKLLEAQREQVMKVWADTTLAAANRVAATRAISDRRGPDPGDAERGAEKEIQSGEAAARRGGRCCQTRCGRLDESCQAEAAQERRPARRARSDPPGRALEQRPAGFPGRGFVAVFYQWLAGKIANRRKWQNAQANLIVPHRHLCLGRSRFPP